MPDGEEYEDRCRERDEARAERDALAAKVEELKVDRDEYEKSMLSYEKNMLGLDAALSRIEAAARFSPDSIVVASGDHLGVLYCDPKGHWISRVEVQRILDDAQQFRPKPMLPPKEG